MLVSWSMKKVLAIIVLGLLISCTQQNRNDEYTCNPISGGATKSQNLKILKDKVKTSAGGEKEYTYSILEEKSDRISFGHQGSAMIQIFYKKTNKYKWDSGSKENTVIVVYDCLKIN